MLEVLKAMNVYGVCYSFKMGRGYAFSRDYRWLFDFTNVDDFPFETAAVETEPNYNLPLNTPDWAKEQTMTGYWFW